MNDISLEWIATTLRTMQTEQRMQRALTEPLPARLSGIEARFSALEARFSALEARFSGVEEALHAIQLTLRELVDK